VKDFPELIAYWSVQEARTGDFRRIAKRLRLDLLSDGERAFLADYLEGKAKPRKLKGGRTALGKDVIAQTVIYLEAADPNHQLEAAVKDVCRVLRVSRSYIFNILKETDPSRLAAMRAGANAFSEVHKN
jgi:hypothetical protein